MVDVTDALEGKYLSTDVVKGAQEKAIQIVSTGKYEPTEWGTRLTLTVEIDGKEKIWRPNRDSVKNLSEEWGKESQDWVGKRAKVQVVAIQGKDSIIASPIVDEAIK